ncbi:MAG: diguanylate cyclase [Chitinivibrionales bacterium]|nr:diguanylate cyclase [Chitinivibrionales bacterium]
MATASIKRPADCTVLIVDDEQAICDFLADALEDSYQVTTFLSAQEAIAAVNARDFDVVIADLTMPDGSGIDVLKQAKKKDEFTEVIIVTGYATLSSATEAINFGAGSYIIKPIVRDDFLQQVERAVATRIFHLRSRLLVQQTTAMTPDAKGHLFDITALYYFSRKLILTQEIIDLMRIIMEEITTRLNAPFALIGVNCCNYQELFALAPNGEIPPARLKETILACWQTSFFMLDKKSFEEGQPPVTTFTGNQTGILDIQGLLPVSIPMVVLGQTIGSLVLFRKTAVLPHSAESQFLFVLSSLITSIVEHAYADRQAKMLARTDSLTGIANHRFFHEALAREMARADRTQSIFSLLLIDIDDFKKVNDTYGHLIGDVVIKNLTQRVTAMVRRCDVLARWGGEEFALLLADTPLNGAAVLADRICKSLAGDTLSAAGRSISYSVSIGLALYTGGSGADKNILIAAADRALYAAKHNGKNRFSVAT